MLKGKIINNNLGDKFIDLNKHISFIDLNIKRISQYIHETEKVKLNTILKVYDEKNLNVISLKKELNLKKLMFINSLKEDLNLILSQNPLNIYNDFEREKTPLNTLSKDTLNFIQKKIYKKDLGVYTQTLFLNRNFKTLSKLQNINQDIKKTENILKDFQTFYNSISNQNLKVSELDLNLFDKGIISKNLKETFYFYFSKLHKRKKTKHFKNNHLIFGLNKGIIKETEIKQVIEQNLKFNITLKLKYLNSLSINEKLKNNILNKYF